MQTRLLIFLIKCSNRMKFVCCLLERFLNFKDIKWIESSFLLKQFVLASSETGRQKHLMRDRIKWLNSLSKEKKIIILFSYFSFSFPIAPNFLSFHHHFLLSLLYLPSILLFEFDSFAITKIWCDRSTENKQQKMYLRGNIQN